jgi:hypothetical protein
LVTHAQRTWSGQKSQTPGGVKKGPFHFASLRSAPAGIPQARVCRRRANALRHTSRARCRTSRRQPPDGRHRGHTGAGPGRSHIRRSSPDRSCHRAARRNHRLHRSAWRTDVGRLRSEWPSRIRSCSRTVRRPPRAKAHREEGRGTNPGGGR